MAEALPRRARPRFLRPARPSSSPRAPHSKPLAHCRGCPNHHSVRLKRVASSATSTSNCSPSLARLNAVTRARVGDSPRSPPSSTQCVPSVLRPLYSLPRLTHRPSRTPAHTAPPAPRLHPLDPRRPTLALAPSRLPPPAHGLPRPRTRRLHPLGRRPPPALVRPRPLRHGLGRRPLRPGLGLGPRRTRTCVR